MKTRRGKLKCLYSDNVTNFHGANNELRKAVKDVERSSLTGKELSKRAIEWQFIPPASPHMGSTWERPIRSVKSALDMILKERAPKEETLLAIGYSYGRSGEHCKQ